MVKLYLMSKKGYKVLDSLINNGYTSTITAVVGASDLNVQNDYYEEIKTLCKEAGIQFFNRLDVIDKETKYSIAISWRWMIMDTELIVFHDSVLPKYRGFAPLVNMLINGETKIGVTALFAAAEYDCGDIISQSFRTISYPIKIQEAIDLIAENYVELALGLMKSLTSNSIIVAHEQHENEATYSLWRDEEDYAIDWTKSSGEIVRFIDAVGYPYKGATSSVNGTKIRIFDAVQEQDVVIENRVPGKVIFMKEKTPVVVCGKGLIRLTEMKNEDNSKAYASKNFRVRFC